MLGSGNPVTAKIGLLLEAPGKEEVIWKVDDEAEVERRVNTYPNLAMEFLRRGMPVVGKSGVILFSWGLQPVQLTRHDLFIDNVLRCLPPKVGNSQYPKGDERKAAEAWCRQYDRWEQFNPTVSLVQIHPAALAREPSPLPLHIKTMEKAKHFSLNGERPIVLCGGKAVKMWMGHAETVQTWLGHYEVENEVSRSNRAMRREKGLEIKVGKVRKKKLTAKTALEMFLKAGIPVVRTSVEGLGGGITGIDGSMVEDEIVYHVDVYVSEGQYKELAGLLVPKVKKEKP